MAGNQEDPSIWSDDDEQRLLDIYIDLRSDTSMTHSDKRAQVIADAVTEGVISDQRNSFIG